MTSLLRLMSRLYRLRASPGRTLERRLLSGESIDLVMGPDLTVRVDLVEGAVARVISEYPLHADDIDKLVLHARYAADHRAMVSRTRPDPDSRLDNPGIRAVPVRLTPERETYVGDVLAAYQRLTRAHS